MAVTKITYASPATITHTPASLTSGSYDGSTAETNASNLFMDALVGGFVTTGTTPTGGTIDIYAYASWDGGTTYTAGMSGTDGDSPDTGESANLRFLGSVAVDTTDNHRYEYGPFSIAGAFGGVMPEKWGIVISHDTGVNLHATAGNHEAKYTGITYTSA